MRKLHSIFYILLSVFLSNHVAYAAKDITGPGGILCTIAAQMFWILIALSSIMVLYAAFLYITSSGETEKVTKAHKTLLYAAIAIAVSLIAKGFPEMVATIVGETLSSGSAC